MKKLISAIPPLTPISIYNAQTGEQVTLNNFNHKVTKLVKYVQTETSRLYETFNIKLCKEIKETAQLGSANSFARQRGYKSNSNLLASDIKAKSRINELILHKLVSETASYVNNPNLKKQPPTFGPKINLGAVDKQMVTISINQNTLTLLWKCWDEEYLTEFIIPNYVLKRNISKWSLPTVEIQDGKPVFIYSIQEIPKERKIGKTIAGLDLGRTEPYTIAVINPKGNRVAHYTTNSRLKQLNCKRENLILEKQHLQNKIKQYIALNLDIEILTKERNFKRNKTTILGIVIAQQLGAEVTQKLTKHNLNILNIENLRWVTGVKYGSRWNHSKQQEALTHSLYRQGIQTKKIDPKNTSQKCGKCDLTITHNSKTRTVWCANCKTRLDRDFNAAMNIARKGNRYPVVNRTNGG